MLHARAGTGARVGAADPRCRDQSGGTQRYGDHHRRADGDAGELGYSWFGGRAISTYLPDGLPAPNTADPLTAPYWNATRAGRLRIQKCGGCAAWQWGPEWICHRCHSFDLGWEDVASKGRIYSYQRPHHPVHAALNGHGPYVVVLVELPHAGNVRMVGNLLGGTRQDVEIGAAVEAVFEPRADFTLVQWRLV